MHLRVGGSSSSGFAARRQPGSEEDTGCQVSYTSSTSSSLARGHGASHSFGSFLSGEYFQEDLACSALRIQRCLPFQRFLKQPCEGCTHVNTIRPILQILSSVRRPRKHSPSHPASYPTHPIPDFLQPQSSSLFVTTPPLPDLRAENQRMPRYLPKYPGGNKV